MAATAIALIGLFNMLGTQTAGVIGDKLRKKYLLANLYMARSIIFLIFFIVPVSLSLNMLVLLLSGRRAVKE